MTQTINSIFEAQQKHKYTLRNSNATQRIDKLKTLKATIEKYEKDIYAALQSDLRKSRFETAVTELFFIYSELDFAIKNIGKWMKPKRAGKSLASLMAKNRIYYEPKGACLIISPWNYPFQLMMSPLLSAIAAGNCAILKPSELSPATSSIISKIIKECFEEQEICCFEGDATVSTTLLNLPFDHIFFTGSTVIGKIVMAAAAKHLTSVTLELGGKSPTIIDESANLKKAAEKIAWGKLVNAGQTCIAPDYILIPEKRQGEFILEYAHAATQLFFNSNQQINENAYAKIINEKHFNRLINLMNEATEKGAKIAFGGGKDEARQTINPTVLTQVNLDSRIMKEEIFGPILPIITYQTPDEAIGQINSRDKPLALYIFSENAKNIDHIIKNTSAGGTCVNDVLIHISNSKLPFGGVNSSGMGSCHGFFGFKTFSHERAVVFQSAMNMGNIVYPPYEGKYGLLKWLKKLM
ncbi:MAG: aldehyde dehydrogenase family protein [Candidatus Pedobacter colombiensis]|uniref:Aldehyde dehydrogenase n=1 Tax=Candidatus Pedobacter colombiensis TaxID=3121371 RepID=A0AAJ5W758_9SPHI|nr:aldehyde dehydrogenase family protein [Pedobacter sp.]WEK19297.1 MAG: aldehyde dehydrogenase family protein [Pedobacter sp.]